MVRIDSASRFISAPAATLYQAFSTGEALARWLPPAAMRAEVMHFDFVEGAGYRMRLYYTDSLHAEGKTAGNFDEVEVRFLQLETDRKIEQLVRFQTDDPAFAGDMHMTWTFTPRPEGTEVAVQADGVPRGIAPADHIAGFEDSLANLDAFVRRAQQPL